MNLLDKIYQEKSYFEMKTGKIPYILALDLETYSALRKELKNELILEVHQETSQFHVAGLIVVITNKSAGIEVR